MGKLFPTFYDLAMMPLERTKFKKIRSELIPKAKGRVLEIGYGTGVNFPYYENASSVDAIEPSREMMKRASRNIAQSTIPIKTHLVGAEHLPFEDHYFDTVVATLVFCTIPDPVVALNEIKRVTRPNGKILFFEHVRMDERFLGKTQDFLTPSWKKICDGCHLNRDTLDLITSCGLTIDQLDSYYKGLFLTVECTNS